VPAIISEMARAAGMLLVGYYLLKVPYDDLVGWRPAPPATPPSCVLDPDGADRTARHRVGDDLSVNDDRGG
jgi:hypothetical protein